MSQTAAELEKVAQQSMPFPPSHYVLKPDMMEKMKYPLPKQGQEGPAQLPEGFIQTQPSQDPEGKHSLVPFAEIICGQRHGPPNIGHYAPSHYRFRNTRVSFHAASIRSIQLKLRSSRL